MPTVSLVLTINNRTPAVSKAVGDSFRLPGNKPDEVIVVLDRPTEDALLGATAAYGTMDNVRFVHVDGPPGWLCPARAWNAGFKTATGDLLYLISSEVVQDAGNVEKARTLAADMETAVFGACHNSIPEQLVVGADPGLLVSGRMARPLGFIACLPRANVMKIGGMDEAFMTGYWYDDDDFFLRLWRTGLNFVFDDSIHGVHQHHERPDLNTAAGQAGIAANAATMSRKHGLLHPWPSLPRRNTFLAGVTRWDHI